MKDSLLMIKEKDMERSVGQMDVNMLENGKQANNMERNLHKY